METDEQANNVDLQQVVPVEQAKKPASASGSVISSIMMGTHQTRLKGWGSPATDY